ARWWPTPSASSAARKSNTSPSKQRHLAVVNWRSLRRVEQADDQPLVLEPVLVAHQEHQVLFDEVALQFGAELILPAGGTVLTEHVPKQRARLPIDDFVFVFLFA